MAVDADRERVAELGHERRQGVRTHHVVVLEDRVEPDDGQVLTRVHALHSRRLGQRVVHTCRAQHLERLEHHHPPPEVSERDAVGVQPDGDVEIGRGRRYVHTTIG